MSGDRSSPIGVILAFILTGAILGGIALYGLEVGLAKPALFALLAIATPFMAVIFVPVASITGDKSRAWFSTIFGFLTAAFTISLIPYALTGKDIHHELSWVSRVGVPFGLHLDTLGVMMAVIAGCVGALALLFSTKFMEREENLTRYYCLTLFFIGGMIGFGLSDCLVALYIFWEILGFCSYALISFWFRDPRSANAGIKAFITTRFGDIGLLAGLVILFVAFKTLSIQSIIQQARAITGTTGWMLAWAGALFILAAVGKSAQVPLQVWLPDAMEAPSTITALIHAATMVNAGVYLIARTLPIFTFLGWWMPTVMIIGSITALLAAGMAMYEVDFKRSIAYCTISQLGYMMAALGLTGGLLAGTFHLMSHSIFKALMFLCAGSVIYAIGKETVHLHADMFEYRGIGNIRRMPITNITFLIAIFSLMGVPGFSGFWSKDLIFSTALHSSGLEFASFIILSATAVLTVAYALRMYYLVFMGEPKAKTKESPPAMTVPLGILAALAMISWLSIGSFSGTMHNYFPKLVEAFSIGGIVHHTFTSPAVIATGIAFLLGYLGFKYRERIYAWSPDTAKAVFKNKYGFDLLYEGVITGYHRWCEAFRKLQTGDANYNIVGIVIGFIIAVIVAVGVGIPY